MTDHNPTDAAKSPALLPSKYQLGEMVLVEGHDCTVNAVRFCDDEQITYDLTMETLKGTVVVRDVPSDQLSNLKSAAH